MSTYGRTEEHAKFYRCALYSRYSTVMQRPASIEDQERSCREFAEQVSWVIVDEHIYKDEALSGTTRAGRLGLDMLLEAAKLPEKPFDYLLVDDTSRLSRDLQHVLEITNELLDIGIGIHFVSQNLDSKDDSFNMQIAMYGMFDEQHIKRLQKRIKAAQAGVFNKGYNAGSLPYGYVSVPVHSNDPTAIGRAAVLGHRLEVNQEQAAVIRRIF